MMYVYMEMNQQIYKLVQKNKRSMILLPIAIIVYYIIQISSDVNNMSLWLNPITFGYNRD